MLTLSTDNAVELAKVSAFHKPEFLVLTSLFKKYGYEIRVAGGAVRDLLMSIDPKDIDLATTATPDQMIDMFNAENIRMLNRNGESHGTVTVRINDSQNYEITTLRIDQNPDGRHADVSFTTDWRVDASRRDLTVNSMFLTVNVNCDPSSILPNSGSETCQLDRKELFGTLHDYFNGFDDLNNRRIRFVGSPAERIKEDYLRILRYFRFHGKLASDAREHDPETLKAIAENSGGLVNISGERIWTELRQILLFPSTPSLLRLMSSTYVAEMCGLPAEMNWEELERVWSRKILNLSPNPATCLAAALNSLDEVETLVQRIHPSNFEYALLKFLISWREKSQIDNAVEYLKREFLLSTESSRLKPLFEEALRYIGCQESLDIWMNWEPPRFPVNGHMLELSWNVKGRILRPLLQGLREAWVESGFKMTTEDLLTDRMREKLMSESNLKPTETFFPVKRRRH